MQVLGINLGATRHGKLLKDGGACIIQDGKILVAVAEERACRKKHAGGFTKSLEYCLNATGLKLEDFQAVVVSSCCEDFFPREICDVNCDSRLWFVPSHHLSHAYSAFFVSPFEQALVIVMDGGGNVLGRQTHLEWWKNFREQNSYYIGEGNSLTRIGRDFESPYEAGFGEAYRCFTYYLGWPSSDYAGKTMALAAYGDPERFTRTDLFYLDGEKLGCRLRNDPLNPIQMLLRFSKEYQVQIDPPCSEGQELTQCHKDLARFIQDQLEQALLKKVELLCKKTGITNLCIAGGVGLNCVANAKILESTSVRDIFIQPAAGDQGQALGNALYGYHGLMGQPREIVMKNAYFGQEYTLNLDFLSDFIDGEFTITRSQNIAQDVAEMIANGLLVGWFQGRSELGPRALGNRSILADPRNIENKRRLSEKVKEREWFRPYAPSILEECVDEFFTPRLISPFMLLAAEVKCDKRDRIPGVVHKDGRARLHTVSREDNPLFYEVIDSFRKITKIPLVLNTSFNGRGEPIVETPQDAFQCFKEHNLDRLVIGDYVISRQL